MVFTMALESDEARAAVEAAQSAGGKLLLVPHIEGRYASVGVIAEVMEEGALPGGLPAVAVRGDQRATIGTGVPGTGAALWVEAEPLVEAEPTPAVAELAREYRAVLENILLSRGAGRIATQLRDITDPGRLADVAGYSPDLTLSQKVEVLETLEIEARLRLVLGWARDTLADLTLRERIKTDVEEGMEKTQREFLLRRQLEAIRKELGQLGIGDGDAADPTTTAPSWPSAICPNTCGSLCNVRSTSSSAPVTRARRRDGSAPGSTPSSSFRGAWSRRTGSKWPKRRACWTPIMTGWRT
jgi:ATP-dependent Lon protease